MSGSKSLDTVLLDFVHEMRQRLADKDEIIAKLQQELVSASLAPQSVGKAKRRKPGRKPKFNPETEIETGAVDVAKFRAESEALDRGRVKRKYTRRSKSEGEVAHDESHETHDDEPEEQAAAAAN